MRDGAVALMCVALVAACLAAQSESADVREFQARRFAAMVHHDVAAVAGCLGDDLTYTHTSGETETKPQFLETLRSGRIEYDQIEPVDITVRAYGQTAITTGRSTMHIRAGGQAQTFQIRFIEVDVRRDGRWQTIAWQATRLPQ